MLPIGINNSDGGTLILQYIQVVHAHLSFHSTGIIKNQVIDLILTDSNRSKRLDTII